MDQRERLFCILAVQNGFVTREEMAATLERVGDEAGVLQQHVQQIASVGEHNVQRIDQIVDCVLERYDQDVDRAVTELRAGTAGSLNLDQATLETDAEQSTERKLGAEGGGLEDTVTFAPSMMGGTEASVRESRFRIIRQHAQGGLGVVHLAEDEQFSREVALKQIRLDRADDPRYRVKFIHEAEVTGQLEHPGIVPIYSMGSDEQGRPFYAMRFIRGESFAAEIRNLHKKREDEELPFDNPILRQLLRRIIDVCNAMAYAHDSRVLHRDLKPSNVMLGKYGETLVVDWGLAKNLKTDTELETVVEETATAPSGDTDVETAHGNFVGTLAYASPEQLMGDLPRLSGVSDVYSIGVMLFETMTGRPPVQKAGSPQKALEQLEQLADQGCASFNAEIPDALAAICDKAMRLRPEERYPDAVALAEDLERWLDDRAVSAYSDPFIHRAFRWARKNQAKATATLVGGLATILLFSGYFILESSAAEREANLQAEKAKSEAQAASATRQGLVELVEANEARGDMKGAIETLEEIAVTSAGLSANQSLDLAEKYFLNQQLTPALETFDSLDESALDPKQLARRDLILGDILYGTSEESKGEELLVRALDSGQLPPSDTSYIRGILASTPEECVQELTNCLNLQPQKSMARVRLAMTLMFTGQPRKAIETAELGKLLSPQDWRFDMAIAFSYATMADSDAMEAVLEPLSDKTEAVPLTKFCRVIYDMHAFVNEKFQRPQPQLQMTDVLKMSTMVADIMTQVVPAVLASQQADGLAIPKLGWVGNLYDRVGTPALEPTQLSMWLMQLFLSRNLGWMIQELAELMPNHRMVQSFQMLNMIESRSFEENLEMLRRIDQTEQTLDGLDLNLAVWVVPTIANQEPAVEAGTRRRLDQIRVLQPWADRLRTTFSEHEFKANGEEELVLAVAWGLLVKNGYFSEATSIVESQLERGIWTGAAKTRWEARLSLSREFEQEYETHMKDFSLRISKDPRYIIMPKPDPPATEAEASDADNPFR